MSTPKVALFSIVFAGLAAVGCAGPGARLGPVAGDFSQPLGVSAPMATNADIEDGLVTEPLREDVEVEVGAIEVDGLEVGDVVAATEGLSAELRACPETGRGSSSTELTVSAKIGPHGEVRFAKSEGGELLSDQEVACITGQVARLTFDRPSSSDPTVVIPIAVRYY